MTEIDKVTIYAADPGLKELQAAVNGDTERLPGSHLVMGKPADILVNEEGLLKQMPPNQLFLSMTGILVVGPVAIVIGGLK